MKVKAHQYVEQLIFSIEPMVDQEQAVRMKRYMRNQFDFIGIPAPLLANAMKAFYDVYGVPGVAELEDVILKLWSMSEREYQYIALSVLNKQIKNPSLEYLPLFETLVTTKSWWDTVDHLAANLIGKVIMSHRIGVSDHVDRWIESGDIWLQRTAILFQLKWKKDTDEALLFAVVDKLMSSREFFIQKAIGWALREYSKISPHKVSEYVSTHDLFPLSRKEALKVIRQGK